MLSMLLCVFFVHSTLGGFEHLKRDNEFRGDGWNTILNPAKYFYPFDPMKPDELNPRNRTSLFGQPHYLWGIKSRNDSEKYFGRVTLDKKKSDKRYSTLNIASYELEGTVTCIQVFDRKFPLKGGEVSILTGGLGDNYINFYFVPKKNIEMDYVIRAFVKPNPYSGAIKQ